MLQGKTIEHLIGQGKITLNPIGTKRMNEITFYQLKLGGNELI